MQTRFLVCCSLTFITLLLTLTPTGGQPPPGQDSPTNHDSPGPPMYVLDLTGDDSDDNDTMRTPAVPPATAHRQVQADLRSNDTRTVIRITSQQVSALRCSLYRSVADYFVKPRRARAQNQAQPDPVRYINTGECLHEMSGTQARFSRRSAPYRSTSVLQTAIRRWCALSVGSS